MKASIVTPAYNSLIYLKHTLSSLENQDIGFDNFEIIVIDDGSSDGTMDYLKNYIGRLNLTPIVNPSNLGRAKSRNIGIEKARNEIIIFLDSDIEVKPDFVRLHLEKQMAGEVACVGRIIFSPHLKKNRYMKYLDSKGVAKIPDGSEVPGKYFVTGNSSLPKKILIDIGKIDENFSHYGGEDTDIGLRIAEKIPIINLKCAVGYNQRFRNLNDTLVLIEEYGKYSLPYLLKKHPNFIKDIKVERGLNGLLYDFIGWGPFYIAFKMLAQKNLAPSLVFNYLLMRSYRKGYFSNK